MYISRFIQCVFYVIISYANVILDKNLINYVIRCNSISDSRQNLIYYAIITYKKSNSNYFWQKG